MSTFVWILLSVLYFVALVSLGLSTLRNGHTILFFFGLMFPLLWVVGTVMPPTNEAQTAAARANLH